MDLTYGIVIALGLALVLLVPFLIKEIRDGKRELGPLRRFGRHGVTLGPTTPTGTGDTTVGARAGRLTRRGPAKTLWADEESQRLGNRMLRTIRIARGRSETRLK